jgi:hypothetical protein
MTHPSVMIIERDLNLRGNECHKESPAWGVAGSAPSLIAAISFAFSRWSQPSTGGRPTASGRLRSVQPRTCFFWRIVALMWFDQFTWHKQISLALSVNSELG